MDLQLYHAVKSGDENFIRELQSSNQTTLLEVTPQGGTVLHAAARFRRTDIARMILEWHPSLLCLKNSKGDTPLHIAARVGDSDMVRLLVDYSVDQVDEADRKLVQVINMKAETALHDAVRGGHLKVVELLTEKHPLLATLTTGGGESPLFLAVERMRIQVAEHILSILSDDAPFCSFQGRNKMNALHAAIIRGCNLDFIKELLAKSPSVILEGDNSGWTALHHAACLGEQSILEELLSTDNCIGYARDEEGMTALHIAAKEGRVDIMQKLAQLCPDIWDLVDNEGQTALHVATKIGKAKIVKSILKEVPEDIINQLDYEGNSSLHLAALDANFEIVELLIDDVRVDKTATNNKGITFMGILLSMVYRKFPSQAKVIDRGDNRGLASLERVINKRNEQGMLSVNEVEHTKKISMAAERIVIELEQLQEGSGKPFKNNIPAVKVDEFKAAEDIASNNIVVATLIAGVSFTAAVTVPGGYKSDGPDAGTAILGKKVSFTFFFVFNTLAFAFSFGSLFWYFISFKSKGLQNSKMIRLPILYSVICLLLAFATSSYTVLPESAVRKLLSAYVLGFFVYTLVVISIAILLNRWHIAKRTENPQTGTRLKANLRGLRALWKGSC